MHIIWKTNKINNRNLRYWSDDGGLSWYWIGSRKPQGQHLQNNFLQSIDKPTE